MQTANNAAVLRDDSYTIRVARSSDAAALQRLLRHSAHSHIHLDWYTPGDWLGDPGFVVGELADEGSNIAMFAPSKSLRGCLAIAADPLPAAWVRVAAILEQSDRPLLDEMLAASIAALDPATEEIAWFMTDHWPATWLEELEFAYETDVLSYLKSDSALPSMKMDPPCTLRPAARQDMETLAEIEVDAFAPRWRHSAKALQLAWVQSLSFDVAVVDEVIVGFQFSHKTLDGAHLSRMTVLTEWQRKGVGSALLTHALQGYHRKGITAVTLNTQSDNRPSQALYERFGFRLAGPQYPIWTRQL